MKIKNVSIKERASKSSYSESVTDSYFYKNIETTINKWLNLQKIIKESQSLEKIIEKQHKDNFEQMKKYIDEFYNLKLKARKLYEDIKFLKMRTDVIENINAADSIIARSIPAEPLKQYIINSDMPIHAIYEEKALSVGFTVIFLVKRSFAVLFFIGGTFDQSLLYRNADV